MARIVISGLCKRLGTVAAVQDLSLDVEDHEFVAFLGPSGCGKTTTLRLLAGFLRPDAGTIAVDDRVISSPDAVVPPERRRMGMVFQQYAVWPHMDVFGNVAFGLTFGKLDKGEIRERVRDVLRLVGLEGMQRRSPAQLSGGQQQRVALARALVVEPDILLLDEPLSNLDAKMRERMRLELKDLQQRTGITFVYVTHDQTEALALADRVALMHDGRVEQWGRPQDVYEQPRTSFVADFMGLVNWMEGEVSDRSEDRRVVRTGNGLQIMVERTDAVQRGDRVRIAVRPDDVAISRDPFRDELNSYVASVHSALFLGGSIQYQLDLDGLRLIAQGPRYLRFAQGERVYVRISAERCNVLTAD